MGKLSSSYLVRTQNATGTIVGEHNTIYQYFQQPAHARLASKSISFLPLIADKTEGFVGRQFVLDALDSFLTKNMSGYFVIQGEPGIGKTALLAQLVKRRGYPHHFNVAPQNIRTPHQFLANACAQIIARYKLPYDSLPEGAIEDSSFLVQCLGEATAKLDNRPVVLVVDALDESDHFNLPPRVNVLYLPPSLPEGAYIVITSRPLDDLKLQVAYQQSLFLEPGSDGNLVDIRAYIGAQLQSNEQLQTRLAAWGMTEALFTEALAKKSEGNFAYLHYILPAIAEGKFKKGSVTELPQGLRVYYRDHWNQMRIAQPDEFEKLYVPIICLLAVAREPVTVEQLHRWTAVDPVKIRQALAQWREFLDEEAADPTSRYLLYHTSFQDFLRETVDLQRFDKLIGLYYLDLLQKR